MHHDAGQPPVGFALLIGGGVLAQVTPTTTVGAAGLIASLSGLLLAAFQYYKVWMDSRERDRQIAEQDLQIAGLKEELVAASDKRHKMRSDFNGAIIGLQADLQEAKLEAAHLKGQLGITTTTHARAINTVSDSVAEIGERLDPPVDVPHPHLATDGGKPEATTPIPGGPK